MCSSNSFVNKILSKKIIQNRQKIQLHFCFPTQSLVMEITMKGKKAETSQSPVPF